MTTDFIVHTVEIDDDGLDWGSTVRFRLRPTRDDGPDAFVLTMSDTSDPWSVIATELTPEQLSLFIAYLQAGASS